MTNYMPESKYFVDSKLTRENLNTGDIVTGIVTSLVTSKQFLVVNLGNFNAIMPFEYCSIYENKFREGYIDPNIFSLIGRTIRARVVKTGTNIIISRKELMKEALDYFKRVNPSEFTVVITGFNKLSAFVDVGAGIHGRIMPSEFANIHFNNIQDIGLKIGDSFTVKNIGYNEEVKSFELSRMAVIFDTPHNYQRDDNVNFKVFKSLNDRSGYLGLIDNKYLALLDSRRVRLSYGDEVIGIVKEVTDKGTKLKFISFKEDDIE